MKRRHFLKSSGAVLAAVTTKGLANSAGPKGEGTWRLPVKDYPNALSTAESLSPRERQLLDFGWRFQFGHAADPAKDFGLGARRRELQFAKSGGFLPVARTNFDDSAWP